MTTLEIPVVHFLVDTVQKNRGALTIYSGTEDELPQGPTSFDIAPNGDILIADPLADRLVLYSAQGEFIRSLHTRIPLSRIRRQVSAEDSWIGESRSGDENFLFHTGSSKDTLALEATPQQIADPDILPVLHSAQHGILLFPSRPGLPQDTLDIDFEGSERLVSLQYLGTQDAGEVLVALESASEAGDSVDVHLRVRRYDSTHSITGQIDSLDVNPFSHPLDPFRLAHGKLYRMVPKSDRILIQIWQVQ